MLASFALETLMIALRSKIISFAIWTAIASLLSLFAPPPPSAVAQLVSELPRAEYYVARELYRVGRNVEAIEGFKAALNRARRVGEQRWVDSIPPIVLLGECFYQQGNIALAMEHYDNALLLMLANPGWMDQLDLQIDQLPELEGLAKSINWFSKSRPTKSVAVPAAVQLAVDPTQAQVTPQGGVVAPVSLITQLDATEVLRTIGIALMRRGEILGPLSKHSPLGEPLRESFSRAPSNPAPWLASAWRVLQGIHSLSTLGAVDGRQLLREGMLVGNKNNYFMSSLALLVLGKLEAGEGSYQAAIVSLQDAALLAAEFEQYDTLSEATANLAACAAASQRVDLLEALQRLAVWSNKKSGIVQLTALLGAAELAIYGNDLAQADKLLKQGSTVLRGREAALPRSQAQLAFQTALLGFAQNRGPVASTNLGKALQIMHGGAASGAVIESVFQTQLTLDLLAGNSLTNTDAEAVLLETIAEPSQADWELHPLRTIAELTTPRIPAFEQLLELAILRNAGNEQLLQRMDQVQCQRFHEALPLGGRLFAWRNAVDGGLGDLSPESRRVVESTLQRSPILAQLKQQIQALTVQLRNAPLPLDERKTSNDAKKIFAELEDAAASFESQLAFQSLQRKRLDQFAPPSPRLDKLQSLLADTDVAVGFVTTPQHIYGVALKKDVVRFWQAGDVQLLNANLQTLLSDIGVVRTMPLGSPAEVTASSAAWRKTAQKISSELFPPHIQELIASCQRMIVVPNERLWYLPFELLPIVSPAQEETWVVHHAVTYVPTLGCLEKSFAKRPAINDTVGVVASFFSNDPVANQLQAEAIAKSVPNSHLIALNQKVAVPPANWVRLRTDQLWVASEIDNTSNGWEAVVLPLGKSRQSRIGGWLETPRSSPALVVMPGLQNGLKSGQLRNGNEIFLPVCSLMFSGTQSACLSRWPAAGTSAGMLLQRHMDELQFERPSDSLRRAILSQWPVALLIADEPALLPVDKDSALLTDGSHPLLWAGYMCVGDFATQP